MRWLPVLALVLVGCVDSGPTDPTIAADLACEGARVAVLYRLKPPSPAPVSDVCENCDGKGKIRSGDGISIFTCPVCRGTGKKDKSVLIGGTICTSGSCRP
jgi:DnaJ-class molecular chaperone